MLCTIWDANNDPLTVTNIGSGGASASTLSGVPVCTVDDAVTSRFAIPVRVLANNATATTTATGTTKTRILTANSTAVAIKATGGNLYAINIINRHSATIYVKFYNVVAASVNPASDVPVLTLPLAASGGGFFLRGADLPITFATAISVRAVTEDTDTGTTAPGTLPVIETEHV